MMKRISIFLLSGVFFNFMLSAAFATPYLVEYAFNVDGDLSDPVYYGDPVPAEVDISSFDTYTGLGIITATISGTGDHSFDFFVDLEIDESINTFYNEFGTAYGTPDAEQSWEIDEPGWVFGDIFINLVDSSLDNNNNVPSGLDDDVSMALGWDFSLADGEIALLSFSISQFIPTVDFYLAHTDPDSNETIYFFSSFEIQDDTAPVPEPGTFLLFATGLLGFPILKRKFSK
jgi:hypothetical protein